MSIYKKDFYTDRHTRTQYAAEAILSQVIEVRPSIASAIDIGCGVGTWLNVLQKYGVGDIQGVDGPWVEQKYLEIPSECFRAYNFQNAEIEISFNRRYDLAICLEVAEHIPQSKANAFVRNLTTLSDLILFSAAIPGQGGLGHINEQWPSYWASLFLENGYVAKDILRFRFWNDNEIPLWYRQNIILYVSEKNPIEVEEALTVDMRVMPIVHPALLKSKTEIYSGQALKILVQCLIQACRRRFGFF